MNVKQKIAHALNKPAVNTDALMAQKFAKATEATGMTAQQITDLQAGKKIAGYKPSELIEARKQLAKIGFGSLVA